MMRTDIPSDEFFVGTNNTLINCPWCEKQMGLPHSAKAYEGDWVSKCWSCGFMWTQEAQ
jgi:hypothetical protein